MSLAPIAVFVYNRLEHTIQTIESLLTNTLATQSEVFIFSDAAKCPLDIDKVRAVRNYIHSLVEFKSITIVERETNLGLAKSVISGVSELMEKFGKAIVLEDDLLLSSNFLEYMNKGLDFYQEEKRIFSISGYCANISIPKDYTKDVFVFQRINSWGWACWADRWNSVDWEVVDFHSFMNNSKAQKEFNKGGEECAIVLAWQMQGKIDSWAIRFNYGCFRYGGLNVYPRVSKVRNIGADGSGSHVKKTHRYDTVLDESTKATLFERNLQVNPTISHNYYYLFSKKIHRRIINWWLLTYYRLFKY